MDSKRVIQEFEQLPENEQMKVFSYLNSKERRKQYALFLLSHLKGAGKGTWNMDAQEYLNQLRSDERF
jgi:hypothetical protein